ncbi:DNA polymerase/3'-5' exonuclease PolX [Candidatus Uhrbacteria bacterium]|nr:DNA polymerase/3'-5' exonuclease PolX [Candidatus Uhrbacteria bacterium]
MKSNLEIAKILAQTAFLYEMEGVAFRPRTYERAGQTIGDLDEEVAEIWKREGRKGLDQISGVGPGLAHHLEDILKTGTFTEYERLRKKLPVNLDELTTVEGVGPKTVKTLYEKLRIKNLVDLERAAKAGQIRSLPRFGQKAEEKILKGIEFQKKNQGRFLLGDIRPTVEALLARVKKIPGTSDAVVCGSYRRWQETVGDIDIQAAAQHPPAVIEAFVKFPEVAHIYGKGPTKANVRLKLGIDADLRVVPKESFGAALQYFTGDKTHNIELRKFAIKKGYKLSEYGLFRGQRRLAGASEEEVYKKLGMDCLPPEIRTASGELEAAQAGKLPKLIPYGSLKGDLQVQTNWTDGSHSIAEMAAAAKAAGLSYIAITDHTKSLAMTHGLDEKRLAKQGREIDALNRKLKQFRVLKGSEVNILKDGSLDLDDRALRVLDLVCVAVHSHFGMTEAEMTKRIIRALKHPLVNILFHPTGRVIGRREPYRVNIPQVLRAAKEYGVAMEVNAYPDRLDLRDAHIRDAVRLGVKLVIDSDAHHPNHFKNLDYGLAQARRGWATLGDVLNTKLVGECLKSLKGLKKRK